MKKHAIIAVVLALVICGIAWAGATNFPGGVTTPGTVTGGTITDGTLSTTAGAVTGIASGTIADDGWIGIALDAERIVFDSAGDVSVMGANVGIGTTSPGELLHIKKDQNAETSLLIDNRHTTASGTSTSIQFGGYRDITDPYTLGKIECIYEASVLPGSIHDSSMAFSTHKYAGGDLVERMRIDSSGNVGIGTTSPGTFLELDSTAPYVTIKNNTEEDSDGGRESKIIFEGEQSGGEITTLAQIQASHDGASDDQKGDLIFYTNDGSDDTSPTERLRIDSDGKISTGGETAPDVSSGGLTITHGSVAAGFDLTFKDTGVNHGMTTKAETDSFCVSGQAANGYGGFELTGLTELYVGLNFESFATSEASTTNASSSGAIQFRSRLKSGTSTTEFSADGNIVTFHNNNVTTHIFKGDGDIYYDGADQGAYDDEEDLKLVAAARYLGNDFMEVVQSKPEGYTKTVKIRKPKKELNQNQARLIELGIINEKGMTSNKKMTALKLGAINQLWDIVKDLKQDLSAAKAEIAQMRKDCCQK